MPLLREVQIARRKGEAGTQRAIGLRETKKKAHAEQSCVYVILCATGKTGSATIRIIRIHIHMRILAHYSTVEAKQHGRDWRPESSAAVNPRARPRAQGPAFAKTKLMAAA